MPGKVMDNSAPAQLIKVKCDLAMPPARLENQDRAPGRGCFADHADGIGRDHERIGEAEERYEGVLPLPVPEVAATTGKDRADRVPQGRRRAPRQGAVPISEAPEPAKRARRSDERAISAA